MQQKVAIAMMTICNTDIILLDEPTLGLDVQSFMDIKDILKEISTDMNKTILLSTHDMNLVQEICNDVIILNKGKIAAQGAVEKLLDMFQNMTCEIILLESISKKNSDYLSNSNHDFYFTEDNYKLEINIKEPGEIYDILDTLKEKGILIKEMRQKGINFENVYLNFTSRSEGQ